MEIIKELNYEQKMEVYKKDFFYTVKCNIEDESV